MEKLENYSTDDEDVKTTELRYTDDSLDVRKRAEKAWDICKSLLVKLTPITKQALLDNGLSTEEIAFWQNKKVFGAESNETGLVFVNWKYNKFDAHATLTYYKYYPLQYRREYQKQLLYVNGIINSLAIDLNESWHFVYEYIVKLAEKTELNTKVFSKDFLKSLTDVLQEVSNISDRYAVGSLTLLKDVDNYISEIER